MYTVIRFAKFGTCTVESVNGTLVEDKMRRINDECAHFRVNKYPKYTHYGASAIYIISLTHTKRITVYEAKPVPSLRLFIGE
jgi:hypothetical protein